MLMEHADASVLTAGLDEVGRGALAGPVVAAAVCLNPSRPVAGLADSKKLTPLRRQQLAEQISQRALAWGIGLATADEVDQINVLEASMLAMQRAFSRLGISPQLAVVDGNRAPQLPCRCQTIVGGDGLHAAIAAASILAKVERDHFMRMHHLLWSDYGFAAHKGYGTAAHLQQLARFGPCAQHRRSFAPVQRAARSPQVQGA